MSRPERATVAGESLPARTIGPITQTDIVRFAGAGGDFNPLHHDPAYAQRAGFPTPIAMGQMHAAMAAGYVSDTFGIEYVQRIAVRFRSPLAIGDTLSISGTVDRIEDDGTAHVELMATTEQGTVLSGTAVVRVRHS